MMNKPDKPGWWYWKREEGDETTICYHVVIDEEYGGLAVWRGSSRPDALETFGGIWLGPVPGHGESFTMEQVKYWLMEEQTPEFVRRLFDPKFGIKAFTERGHA